jgi:hypothetical protein
MMTPTKTYMANTLERGADDLEIMSHQEWDEGKSTSKCEHTSIVYIKDNDREIIAMWCETCGALCMHYEGGLPKWYDNFEQLSRS